MSKSIDSSSPAVDESVVWGARGKGVRRDDQEEWYAACEKEFKAHEQLGTFKLLKRSSNKGLGRWTLLP